VFLVAVDGLSQPVQITEGPGGKFSPLWATDGEALVYAVDLDGGENFDLCFYRLNTKKHTNLTPNTTYTIQPNFSWSPEGDSIAFISDLSGRFNTYIMPLNGESPCMVFDQPFPDWDVRWSPDGKSMAVISETRGQDYWTTILSIDGKEVVQISDGTGPICAKDAKWSPDSSKIVFSSNTESQFYEIGIFDLHSQQISWVTHGKGDKEEPIWSPDGSKIAFIVHDGPMNSLAVLDRSEGSKEIFQIEPGVHFHSRFTPNDEKIILVFDNPSHPDDLWVLNLNNNDNGGEGRNHFYQLTNSLPQDLQSANYTNPSLVRYPNLDGESVPALLYQPSQMTGKQPAVVVPPG
jgi:Tol biopolymer transport system component